MSASCILIGTAEIGRTASAAQIAVTGCAMSATDANARLNGIRDRRPLRGGGELQLHPAGERGGAHLLDLQRMRYGGGVPAVTRP
jgi:hypothetical protein